MKAVRRLCTVVAACISLVAALGACGSSTSADDENSVKVTFGGPLKKIALNYIVFYDKKPFPKTDVYLYDNGTYWITSAGENHYGVYVITKGALADSQFEIRFISFPSADWEGAAAYHYLQFDTTTWKFVQDAIAIRDPNVPPQNGTFRIEDTTATPRIG